MTIAIEEIARVCHEANRALCAAFEDDSQVAWDDAPANIRASAMSGVEHLLATPNESPAGLHDAWCDFKRRDGWIYGPVKDGRAKTHPCMVPYHELPAEQKAKDYIFRAIVRSMTHDPAA